MLPAYRPEVEHLVHSTNLAPESRLTVREDIMVVYPLKRAPVRSGRSTGRGLSRASPRRIRGRTRRCGCPPWRNKKNKINISSWVLLEKCDEFQATRSLKHEPKNKFIET
ncbi:hypothetical protein NDU88_001397 [Pleurodeles waltl]|uniref:Uncharacterized protein n=1 Tax=Pleurodeles waltl TaxID=8319 RepID=A0AAV7Q5S9_PLEWA|nr:hypothetical protein NDU88_001397 [Pleurodeles waltl]